MVSERSSNHAVLEVPAPGLVVPELKTSRRTRPAMIAKTVPGFALMQLRLASTTMTESWRAFEHGRTGGQ